MIVKLKFEDNNIVDTATLEQLENVVGESIRTEEVVMSEEGKMVKSRYGDDREVLTTHVCLDHYKEYVCDMELMTEEFPNLKYMFRPIRRATASTVFQETSAKAVKQLVETQAHESIYYNERVEVHMPGQALSMYNEVLLMSDACSDELQTSLAKGWRIIAACPQPDQRRPDYILGRYNPEVGTRCDANRIP